MTTSIVDNTASLHAFSSCVDSLRDGRPTLTFEAPGKRIPSNGTFVLRLGWSTMDPGVKPQRISFVVDGARCSKGTLRQGVSLKPNGTLIAVCVRSGPEAVVAQIGTTDQYASTAYVPTVEPEVGKVTRLKSARPLTKPFEDATNFALAVDGRFQGTATLSGLVSIAIGAARPGWSSSPYQLDVALLQNGTVVASERFGEGAGQRGTSIHIEFSPAPSRALLVGSNDVWLIRVTPVVRWTDRGGSPDTVTLGSADLKLEKATEK